MVGCHAKQPLSVFWFSFSFCVSSVGWYDSGTGTVDCWNWLGLVVVCTSRDHGGSLGDVAVSLGWGLVVATVVSAA